MRIHDLKVAAMHFPALVDGRKKFEFRVNDRDFRVSDYLLLRELNEFMILTGPWLLFEVEYILDDTWYGMPKGHVIMSLSDCLISGREASGLEAYRPHILPVPQ